MAYAWKTVINNAPEQPAQFVFERTGIVSACVRYRMTTGSCLCGNVPYEFSVPVRGIIHCHCATCCKAHVSAFSSVAWVSTANFKLAVAEHIGSFESSHGRHRHFYSNCGTRFYAQREGKTLAILRLVSLDIPLDANEFARS